MECTATKEGRPVVHSCAVYTRVSGYYRPMQSFNDGKVAEHQQRHLLELAQVQ